MKVIMFCLLIIPALSWGCQRDSITIDFQNAFRSDSISLFINGKMVYKGIITTDLTTGLAESITLIKPKDKSYTIIIKSNMCISEAFQVHRKWKYLAITGYIKSCEFNLKLSRKMYVYF